MDDRFAALTESHDFIAAVAGVAATLISLVFVALALNPAVMADDGPAGLHTWADFPQLPDRAGHRPGRLDPGNWPAWIGPAAAHLRHLGVARVVVDAYQVRSDPDPEWHGRQVLTRFASPLDGYAIAVCVGAQILRGDADAVVWLVATVFFLMMSAASNCWDLLREIGDRHQSGPARELWVGLICRAAAAGPIDDSIQTTHRRHPARATAPTRVIPRARGISS